MNFEVCKQSSKKFSVAKWLVVMAQIFRYVVPLSGCKEFELYRSPTLLHTNDLIDVDIGKELSNLIKPLQNNIYNYRDPQFINCSNKTISSKPKLQELVSQFKHYKSYIKDDNNINDKMSISISPTIFYLKDLKFTTEINGLLYKDNVKLYRLIEKAFIKFIPMFEWCLGYDLLNDYNHYKQLLVIIKIQDYIFENENKIISNWHKEGNDNDDIVCIGLYYFDITTNSDLLKFDKNYLEIAQFNHYHQMTKTQKITIKPNDCIIFKNKLKESYNHIRHRAVILTKGVLNNIHDDNCKISRKLLSFFLLNPDNEKIRNMDCKDFKWINYPLKIHIIINYFLNYNMKIIEQIYDEIIILIKTFAFGDDKYEYDEMIKIRNNLGLNIQEDDNVGDLRILTTCGD